jgi:hypothetical protein
MVNGNLTRMTGYGCPMTDRFFLYSTLGRRNSDPAAAGRKNIDALTRGKPTTALSRT